MNTSNKQSVTGEFLSYGVHVIPGVSETFAALITEDTRRLFDYEDVKPVERKKGYRGYVPWGAENLQPYEMLEKIRDDEVKN